MAARQVYSLYRKYGALHSIEVRVSPFYCNIDGECTNSNLYYRHIELNPQFQSIECVLCHSIYSIKPINTYFVEYIFKKVKIVKV